MDQRKQQYNDLLHALKLMRRVDNSTSTGILVLKMYKLETGMLTFEDHELVLFLFTSDTYVVCLAQMANMILLSLLVNHCNVCTLFTFRSFYKKTTEQ